MAAIGQLQSLGLLLQGTAFGCVSGLSPDGSLMGQRDKPRAPISGPSWRPAIDPEPPSSDKRESRHSLANMVW